VKAAVGDLPTHNPSDETYWASGLRENLTSRSYGEGLETGRAMTQAPRQSLTRQTNFFVAQDTAAMEMPRAWTETALARRISMALIAGSLLKAIAAVCAPQAIGPWDRKPVRSGGRLAHYLDLHAERFAALALDEVEPRNYRKNPKGSQINELEEREAA
jgi:hypothetical protein